MQPAHMHTLLKQQLSTVFGESFTVPRDWQGFVDAVNDAYQASDLERNRLERSLESSSRELLQADSDRRAILSVVPDILFRVDAEGAILDCMTGSPSDLFLPREHLIGKKIDGIPITHVAEKFRASLDDVLRTRAAITFEYAVSLGGKERSYEARWIPLREDQTVIVVRNITDRQDAEDALKKSAAFFREITMSSSDIIFIADEKGFITYVSPSVERYTGYHPTELIGKNTLHLIAPDDRPRAIRDFAKALQSGDADIPNIFRIRCKDGTEIMMEGMGKNRFHHPAIKGFVMNVRDVTHRRRAEERLRESERRFRRLASYHEQLNAASITFNESLSTEELYNQIAESLRLLSGAVVTTFALYDPETRNLMPKAVSIDPRSGDRLRPFFGTTFLGRQIPISRDDLKQMLYKGIRRPKDLCELSNGMVPQDVSDAVMERIGCRQLMALAIVYADEPLGTCVAYLAEGRQALPDTALKTFSPI